jgi:hypothetical protein
MAVSELAQLGAGIAIGFGAVGAGLGIGVATKGLMEAMSRQPEIATKALVILPYRCCYGRSLCNLCIDYRIKIVRYDGLREVFD